MTPPIPGDGPDPQPWGGQPNEPTTQTGPQPGWQEYTGEHNFPDMGYTGLYKSPPRWRKPVLIAAAVVVVAGLVSAVLLVTNKKGTDQRAVAPPASARPSSGAPLARSTPPSASGGGISESAYDVGTCFDEQPGTGSGKVELSPVPCGGDRAVFVINKVAPDASGCDAAADYQKHGYEVPDETANVVYCVSLVVPANNCFVNGNGKAVRRTACGAEPDVVQVLAIESSSGADAACQDKPNPDVWFYQSPDSGQYACVSRATASSSGSAAPPTT